jgi:DNA modification methylase
MINLYLGDCLNVMKEIETHSVDSLVTDPPAGIGFMNKEWDDFRRSRNPNDAGRDNVYGRTSKRGPEFGRRSRDEFVSFLSERLEEARRIVKPSCYALVWAIPRTSHWTAWALEEAGWVIRDRVSHLFGTGFPKAKSCLKPACEDWWLAINPGKKISHLQIDKCRIPCDGRYPANVTHDGNINDFPQSRFFYCAKADKKDRGDGNDHPTVKNSNLMRWLSRLITPPGGIVLDPFMGSGSTGMACRHERFGFIGIEVDQKYYDIADKRINSYV